MNDPLPSPAPAPAPRRGLRFGRTFWHALGLVLAATVAWLIVRAYRQPDFLLDFVNLRLC